MYALVEICSKQYKVQEGDTLLVDLQHESDGSTLSFESVLAVVDGNNAVFGTPYVNGAKVEAEVLKEKVLDKINALGIGPGGLGGKTTALAVNINTYPTHIAGLPVAINICCHVNRHAFRTI